MRKTEAESQVDENAQKINLAGYLTTHTYKRILPFEMTTKVVVTELSCTRCRHSWYARRPQPPKVCPNCKRQDWNKPKAKAS